MICARCGVKLVYGKHIRSRYTGNDYCRNYGECVQRVLDANGDGKLVKAKVSHPVLADGAKGSGA